MDNLEKNVMLQEKEAQDTSVTIFFYLFIMFYGLHTQTANATLREIASWVPDH